MYIADNNVFGVDLNPVAVELAEVSLWLNAISSEAFVPWFGYQLFNGNSLIGARRQVFPAHQLTYKSQKNPSWLNQVPIRIEPGRKREDHQVYHFLLGDLGMANYTDKVVKGLKPDEIKTINEWRKEFNKPWSDEDKSALQRISKKIDDLWAEHTKNRATQRQLTTDDLPLWPDKADAMSITNMATKDKMLEKAMTDGASSYQRLKMVMDYWCALWFWPIELAEELPERYEYLADIETLLDGYIQTTPQELEETVMDDAVDSGFMDDLFAEPKVAEQSAQYQSLLTSKGTLNKRVIFDVMPRVKIADTLAARYKYFHWELEFTDIFESNSGFDLILGNPPWLKLAWEEKGLLSDFDPKIAIKNNSANEVATLRASVLNQNNSHINSYFTEYVDCSSTQNFLSSLTAYSGLISGQINIYKNFIPLSINIINDNGVAGLLHPDGIYDYSKGEVLRAYIYRRLLLHFQFQNELDLFKDVHHDRKFSINVYQKTPKTEVSFDHVSNLFLPKTIDDSYNSVDNATIEGIKDYDGKWSIKGYKNRIIEVNDEVLKVLCKLDPNKPDYICSRLLSIHSNHVISALTKLSNANKLGSSLKNITYTLFMGQTEAVAQNHATKSYCFADKREFKVVFGAHFGISAPFTSSALRIKNKEEFIFRGVGAEASSVGFPFVLNDVSPFKDIVPINYDINSYRMITRRRINPTNQRTLFSSVLPPKYLHFNTCSTICFSNDLVLLSTTGAMSSLVFDFLVKSTNKTDCWPSDILDFPFIDSIEVAKRALALNSINESFEELMDKVKADLGDIPSILGEVLVSQKFQNVQKSNLSELVRRYLLIEIDILVALKLGLTLSELISLYKIQFPILRQSEEDTWYDQKGTVVYTSNRSLSGVGLDRKYNKKNDFNICVKNGVFVDGSEQVTKLKAGTKDNPWNEENGQIGWEDIKDLKSGIVTKTYMDDTMHDGPVERTIEYHAPFDRCDREEDYKTVWAEFERRFGTNKE
tara:strand:- start:13865 stop:16837 length:2973 start_codon:yes stop_codon:yes gene_type:complete